MKARTIALLVIAVAAGLAAAYLVTSLGPPKIRAADADYYCYELRQAWVCAYAKTECEARLARETPIKGRKGCTPYWNDSVSP